MMPFESLFEGNDFFTSPIDIFDHTKTKLEPMEVYDDKSKT